MRHTIDLAPGGIIRIGNGITIQLTPRAFRVAAGEVHLAIQAPPDVFIARSESSEAQRKRWRERRDERRKD